MEREGRDATRDVVFGLGLTVLLHLAAVFVLSFLTKAFLLLYIGATQLLYIVPATLIAHRIRRPGIVKGLIIGASLTFLFNAACFGLVFLIFRSSG